MVFILTKLTNYSRRKAYLEVPVSPKRNEGASSIIPQVGPFLFRKLDCYYSANWLNFFFMVYQWLKIRHILPNYLTVIAALKNLNKLTSHNIREMAYFLLNRTQNAIRHETYS